MKAADSSSARVENAQPPSSLLGLGSINLKWILESNRPGKSIPLLQKKKKKKKRTYRVEWIPSRSGVFKIFIH